MPDNDSDLAAWGMRYALIPVASFFYAATFTIIITILILVIKIIKIIGKLK